VMVAYFFGVKDSPTVAAMLKAVRPVVVGLLLWTAFDLSRTVFGANKVGWGTALLHSGDKLIIAAAAFALLTLTKINPALVILAAALLGFVIYR